MPPTALGTGAKALPWWGLQSVRRRPKEIGKRVSYFRAVLSAGQKTGQDSRKGVAGGESGPRRPQEEGTFRRKNRDKDLGTPKKPSLRFQGERCVCIAARCRGETAGEGTGVRPLGRQGSLGLELGDRGVRSEVALLTAQSSRGLGLLGFCFVGLIF